MDPHEQARKKAREWWGKFFGKLLFGLTVLPLVMWLLPWVVPFGYFEPWRMSGTIADWFGSAWPLLAWGVCLSGTYAFSTRNHHLANQFAEQVFWRGALSSIRAGVGEEITFRWLFFLGTIVTLKLGNFLFFGFLGFGIPDFLHTYLFGPIANWFTLGSLEPYLFHASGWAVGASVLATNAFFRDGHKYQGPVGLLNSWFAGMYLFWIMFTYGLPAAILIHFVYDLLVDIVRYVDSVIERRCGYV